jgi:membrane fusion protein, multidrug efflux system
MSEKSDSSSEEEKAPPKEEIKREVKQEIAQAIQGGAKEKSADSEKKGEDRVRSNDGKDRQKKKGKPILKLLIIGAVVLLIIGFLGFRYWLYASSHEETDDAYVVGNTHQIGSRVAGTVESVLVDDNWHVKAGQPLLSLDPRDYEVALRRNRAQLQQANAQVVQARAGLEQANAELLQREAQVAQAEAQIIQSQANRDIATINYNRNRSLYQKDLKAVAQQEVDTTKATLDAAQGALDFAKATEKASKAQVEAAEATVDSAQAQVENTRRLHGGRYECIPDFYARQNAR